jgi:hypothetical protein
MGIKKDINTDYNVIAGFWKCVQNRYCGNGKYEIIVEGWKNKNSFQDKYLPMKRFIYFSDSELVSKNDIENFILSQTDFTGASQEVE